MSRDRPGPHRPRRRFPRVSGDEPGVTDALAADRMFSPRERG